MSDVSRKQVDSIKLDDLAVYAKIAKSNEPGFVFGNLKKIVPVSVE